MFSLKYKNGNIVESSDFAWDPVDRIFSTSKHCMIVDFKGHDDVTFIMNGTTGSSIIAGKTCSIGVGLNSDIVAGNFCMITSGRGGNFKTGDNCIFDVMDDCVFDVGNRCMINDNGGGTYWLGNDCTIDTQNDVTTLSAIVKKHGKGCVIISRGLTNGNIVKRGKKIIDLDIPQSVRFIDE